MSHKVIVYVGSTNPVKVNSCRTAFEKIFGSVIEVHGITTLSNVSDQPMSEKETKKGAINRARNVLETIVDSGVNANSMKNVFCVGIEGGLYRDESFGIDGAIKPNVLCMAFMAVLHPATSRIEVNRTASFVLPPKLVELVEDGKELGEADDIIFKRTESKKTDGTVGILTNGIIDRTQYYHHALVLALIPFFNEEMYYSS